MQRALENLMHKLGSIIGVTIFIALPLSASVGATVVLAEGKWKEHALVNICVLVMAAVMLATWVSIIALRRALKKDAASERM